MNRKTIIFCIVLIAVLIAGAAAAVVVLYSGHGRVQADSTVDLSDSRCGFFAAVPSDAVAVFCFGGPGSAASLLAGAEPSLPLLPDGAFRKFLDSVAAADLGSLRSSQTILSAHYVGGLEPLFIVDLCRSGANEPSQTATLQGLASKAGLYCRVVDCSSSAPDGTWLGGRRILVASTSDVLEESCERHIAKGVSVLDREWFAAALNSVKSEKNFLLISNENSGKIVDEVFGREYRSVSEAVKRMGDWCAFGIDASSTTLKLTGFQLGGGGVNRLMNVFDATSPATSSALSMAPSYAVSVFAMPLSDSKKHIEAYSEYLNTKSGRVKYAAEQTRLRKAAGIAPSVWAESVNPREIALATFYAGESPESVLLLRPGNSNAASGFFGATDRAAPAISDYAYPGFTGFLFGPLFSLEDESKCAVIDGWAVIGSETAVSEYTSGRALETPLSKFMGGAGVSPDTRNQNFIAYFSLSEDRRAVERVFKPKYAASVAAAFDSVTYAPALLTAAAGKGQKKISVRVDRIETVKSNAPEIERDATVIVENGRFSVRNSGTGKMNTFYQQSNMYLCLSDENGKGLWGVAFSTPICGRAGTVDYFANGKLQILFCSGSKLYLIDRLGRFVSPFPVELGKDVLLGPDIYDFSGQRKYNVMVLHTDNTVDMYNLQGRKPADWKGITSSETIMNLPERVDVGGKTFWIVRTSLQTLVYPFYGGEPLTNFKGNDKLRPDTRVTPVSGGIRAVNYAGREVTVNLK